MTKEELVRWLNTKRGMLRTLRSSERVLERLLHKLADELISRGEVGLVGWGRFKLVQRKARRNFNPNTKEMETLPAKTIVKFTPGWILRGKLKAKKSLVNV